MYVAIRGNRMSGCTAGCGGQRSLGDDSGGSSGTLNLVNTALKTGTSLVTAGKGSPTAAAPKTAASNSTNWFAQQSNTTLAIGGTAIFALLLAVTR